jgi:hypothetical protein
MGTLPLLLGGRARLVPVIVVIRALRELSDEEESQDCVTDRNAGGKCAGGRRRCRQLLEGISERGSITQKNTYLSPCGDVVMDSVMPLDLAFAVRGTLQHVEERRWAGSPALLDVV